VPNSNISFGPSPRRGAKSKQRRVGGDDDDDQMTINGTANNIIEEWQWYASTNFGFHFHGKPSTEFMGWRRITPNEIMHLEEGTFFLLSIPPESKLTNKETINLRRAFMSRVYGAVIRRTKRIKFPDNGKSVHDRAVDYLLHHKQGKRWP
jgi:hypothetical protein